MRAGRGGRCNERNVDRAKPPQQARAGDLRRFLECAIELVVTADDRAQAEECFLGASGITAFLDARVREGCELLAAPKLVVRVMGD